MKNKQLYRQALVLAVPMMIQNGITNMVSLIDNVMVGSRGTEAITAVSIAGQLIFVFNLAVFGGLSGPGIFGAQYFGQKNIEGFRNTVRIKQWIGAVCLLLGLTVFIFGQDMLINLYLRGDSGSVNPELTISLAKQYLSVMLWGLPPFVVTQIYATSLRETGESITPMISGVVSVVVDIVFNYLLIYGKLGLPELGVKGAAIATVASRVIEMLIVIAFTFFARREKHEFLSGVWKTIFVPRELAFRFIKKSAPMFLNEFMWAGSLAALTQRYSVRGLEIVAGLNISNALCNMLNVVFVALGSAIGILIGHTLGAAKYDKAKSDSLTLMRFTSVLCFMLTVVLVAASGIFPNFYHTSEQVRGYAQRFIIITALFFPVQGALNAIYFTLRSGGKTMITFLFDGAYSWAVAIPAATVLCKFTTMSIFIVYTVVQALDIIKIIVGYILIKKGMWINNLAESNA